jgi:hypothetical protein
MTGPRFSALYHPSYVPPDNWLKLQLLFWDSVHRIVPDPMSAKFGDDFIYQRFHIDPGLCPYVSPSSEDHWYFDKHRITIQNAFEKIHKGAGTAYETVERFGVHPRKAPEWVFDSLTRLGLAHMKSRKEHGYFDEHYMVHPEAGKLILSCLGSSLASRRNLHPITEQESNFYVTAANEINSTLADRSNSSVEAALGILVLQCQVPSNLAQLNFADVLRLRESYDDLRTAFHNTVTTITSRFYLNTIIDESVYEQELRSCLESYVVEMNKFNSIRQKLIRLVTDWKTEAFTISLGGLGTYAAGGPVEALYIGIASAGLGLAKVLFSNKQVSDVVKSYHYIQVLNKHLDAKHCVTGIRPFLVGVRYD